MELGAVQRRGRLSPAERQRRRDNNLCIVCAAAAKLDSRNFVADEPEFLERIIPALKRCVGVRA